MYDYMQNSYFSDPFCPFQFKNIFVSAEKAKHLHVIQVLINILETGQ